MSTQLETSFDTYPEWFYHQIKLFIKHHFEIGYK